MSKKYKDPAPFRIVITVVVILAFVGSAAVVPYSRRHYGDDRLAGAVMLGLFGVGWLANLGLALKGYGQVKLRLGTKLETVTRKHRHAIYWVTITLAAVLGISCLVGAVLMATH